MTTSEFWVYNKKDTKTSEERNNIIQETQKNKINLIKNLKK